jgi:hypothetical protein
MYLNMVTAGSCNMDRRAHVRNGAWVGKKRNGIIDTDKLETKKSEDEDATRLVHYASAFLCTWTCT